MRDINGKEFVKSVRILREKAAIALKNRCFEVIGSIETKKIAGKGSNAENGVFVNEILNKIKY